MIEEQMEKIFNQLGRIADATEEIALHLTGKSVVPTKKTPVVDAGPGATSSVIAEDPGAKKPGKKSGTAAPAAVVLPQENGTVAYTELDVRNHMREVMDKKGYQKAEEILVKYAKSMKVKDVAAKDYAAVIADAQKVLKG